VPRKPNSSPQAHAILEALRDAPDGWRYGYELCKLTGVKSGTLYPLLMRLHDQGFLQSEWRPPEATGRPPRNAYRLTNEGRRLAATLAAEYNRQSPHNRVAGAH
jgi:DNA-binding PadR family transcriptional regulator